MDKFSNGYCGVICQTDYNLQFISTKLISVDIDDDNRITNPIDVFHQFNAAGLFYTFSHGIKGNRYRLIFQLSEIMTDAKKVNAITKQLTKNMQQKGIPVDTNPTNIYLPVRGGNHAEYKINSDNVLDIDPLITQAEKAAQFKSDKLMKNIKKDYVSIPFKYLKEMAQSIGYIASNTNQYDKWMRIVYAIKYYDQMNHITYKQGLELFQMISGNESSEEEYKHLHPTGDVTIASFIHYAMESGYQSDYFLTFTKMYAEHQTIMTNIFYMLTDISQWKHQWIC